MIQRTLHALVALGPRILILQAMLIPFIILEQVRPAGPRPRVGDYILNILISLTTLALTIPVSIWAAIAGMWVRQQTGFTPLSFSFASLGHVPYVGPALEIVAIVVGTLVLHDMWFYWSHRLEHTVPVLWEFHKLHHSDTRMSSTTWARDHFLQESWRAFFAPFTFGLVLALHVKDAAAIGAVSGFYIPFLSMFYHSGVRLNLPWLNPVLVTPQMHRIHHSVDPRHYNKNFADFLPVFDIIFGTYYRPARDEFPETGLGHAYRAPRNVISAQVLPVWNGLRALIPRRLVEKPSTASTAV